jgi:hypothetical protein
MAILCWAAKNSLRGTLPRCTAGVAEPVLCFSRCLFLTSLWKLSLLRLWEGWLLRLLLGWDHHPLVSTPRRGASGSSFFFFKFNILFRFYIFIYYKMIQFIVLSS